MRIKLFLFSLLISIEFFSFLLFHSVIFASSSEKVLSPLPEKVYVDSPQLTQASPSSSAPTPTFLSKNLEPTKTLTPLPTSPKQEHVTNTPTSTFTPTRTPTPIPSPMMSLAPSPSFTPAPALAQISITGPELEDLFTRFSNEYSVDRETLKKIARCESGFNTNAKNGPYGGMYQFSSSSWNSSRSLMGKDPNPDLRFNPEEGVRTAAFMISRNGLSMWPSCSK